MTERKEGELVRRTREKGSEEEDGEERDSEQVDGEK